MPQLVGEADQQPLEAQFSSRSRRCRGCRSSPPPPRRRVGGEHRRSAPRAVEQLRVQQLASASRDEAALSADSGLLLSDVAAALMFIERRRITPASPGVDAEQPAASSSGPSSAMRHETEYRRPRRSSAQPPELELARWSTAAATSAVSRTLLRRTRAERARCASPSAPRRRHPSMSTQIDDASSAKEDGGPSERRAYSSSSAPAHSW